MSTHILQLRRLALQYPSVVLTQAFDLELYPSEILGVIGANGSGKSTFLKTLLGEHSHYTGEIVQKECPFYLPQNAMAQGNCTLRSYLFSFLPHLATLEQSLSRAEAEGIPAPLSYADDLAEFSERGGFAQEALMLQSIVSLGFQEADLERRIETFSGGERRQLALSAAFLNWPLVLLDEPTNHLDMFAIQTLVNAIQASESTFILVSHDRDFLNQVASRILLIERKEVSVFMGNYSDYESESARILLEKQRLSLRLNREIKHLKKVERDYKDWGSSREKFKKSAGDSGFEGARAARLQKRAIQARNRVREKIEDLEQSRPWMEKNYRFEMAAASVPKGTCLTLQGLSVQLGGKALFETVSLLCAWGERWAISGANGIGKSHLMRALWQGFRKEDPTVQWGKSVRLAYLPQDIQAEDCMVKTLFSPVQYQQARHLMGCFKLRKELFEYSCLSLSEGELRKVFWVRILLEAPNVLLLDEPTSHLDLPSILFLEQILMSFKGTLILVSHDLAFVERLCPYKRALEVCEV